MLNSIIFDQVEKLVEQLPPQEQLKLVARIGERLSSMVFADGNQEKSAQERLAEVDAWLADCDAVAEGIEGEFDSAEELRQIREERANRFLRTGR